MSIRDAISALISSGMDPVDAASLIAAAVIEGSSKKRSSGAERTARYRDRKASQSVTCDGGEMGDDPPPKSSQSVTKRHNVTSAISILESKKERKSAGRSLCDDWKPDETDHEYGRQLGLTRREVEGVAEDMRLWARANANRAIGRKADWRATFRGWMRREAPKIIRQRGGPQGGFKWNGNIEGVI